MATTSNPGGESKRDAAITETQPATREINYGRAGGTIARKPTARKSASGTARKSASGTARKPTSGTARKSPSGTSRRPTSTRTRGKQPRTPVEQAQAIAQRAVLVPIGASLVARDNLVRTVKSLAPKYTTRSGLQREIKRYERRGATARNRVERQVRRTRARVERELRQRRRGVERTLKQNRRRFEREVRSVRRDLEKQSGTLTSRVEKLVSDAQGRINAAS